jgi:hypothetical protein
MIRKPGIVCFLLPEIEQDRSRSRLESFNQPQLGFQNAGIVNLANAPSLE